MPVSAAAIGTSALELAIGAVAQSLDAGVRVPVDVVGEVAGAFGDGQRMPAVGVMAPWAHAAVGSGAPLLAFLGVSDVARGVVGVSVALALGAGAWSLVAGARAPVGVVGVVGGALGHGQRMPAVGVMAPWARVTARGVSPLLASRLRSRSARARGRLSRARACPSASSAWSEARLAMGSGCPRLA